MAGAFLDSSLEKLIRKNLLDKPKVVKEFLAYNGAAGTFSSRIDFCFLLGLVPESIQKDLHLIRKIRNEFGHRIEPISFESQEIKSRCDLLQNNNTPTEARPRLKFTNTSMGVLSVVHAEMHKARRAEAPPESAWTKEQKQQSRVGFLAKFYSALEGLTPEEFGTDAGKDKILSKMIEGLITKHDSDSM